VVARSADSAKASTESNPVADGKNPVIGPLEQEAVAYPVVAHQRAGGNHLMRLSTEQYKALSASRAGQSTFTGMEQHPGIRHAIGIDPGTHTGLAVYSRDHREIVHAVETTFSGVVAYVTGNYRDALIRIETPASKTVWHQGAANQAARDAMAINVGMVIREAQLLTQVLEYMARKHGFQYVIQTPAPQRGLTKLSRDQVRKITGYDGSSNNHVRDAIMLCWGR